MAVDFLNEIYREANMIFNFKKMLRYCHREQTDLLLISWESLSQTITSFCERTTTWYSNLGNAIWDEIVNISGYLQDLNLSEAADKIESLIPQLYTAMALRGVIDVTDENYRLFSSKCGFLCMQDLESPKTFSSTLDPAYEAYEKANTLCTPMTKAFCSFGCGLGYLSWQMYEATDHMADIYIYETSSKRIEYAREYGVLDWIPEDKLHVIVDSDAKKLIFSLINTHLSDGQELYTAFYIEQDLLPTLEEINPILTAAIKEKNATSANFLKNVERNFYSNYGSAPLIDSVDKTNLSKKWIVVGGGPSLDYNIDYLKSNMGSSTIIAATTAVKRLLSEGITPDYAIAIDMQERTYSHLEGLDTSTFPLIISDSAHWKFSRSHKGKVYLIPTSGNYFSTYTYSSNKIKCWDILGTVTAVAIEVAAFCGAERVDLIGLDLAYPGDQTHASGTLDNMKVTENNYIQTQSVDGTMVNTTALFESYRNEIENVIQKNPHIAFYNRSKHGAYIHGCRS